MDLLPLFQWFEATAIGTTIRESLWMFPMIQCGHLLALAMLGGAVLVVDLRLLGLGLRSVTVAELARAVHPWLVGSLATIVGTGVLMFLSEAMKCFYSPPYWYKMGLLLVATVFAFTVRRRVLGSEVGRVGAWLTAVTSMGLWLGVGFAGRWIAFY